MTDIIRDGEGKPYSNATEAFAKALDTYGKTIDAAIETTGFDSIPIITNYDGSNYWVDATLNSAKTRIYTTYFSGTADSAALLSFAHGVTASKIVNIGVNLGGYVGTDGTIITQISYGTAHLSIVHLSMINAAPYCIRLDYTA